jgi:hypothetical protein
MITILRALPLNMVKHSCLSKKVPGTTRILSIVNNPQEPSPWLRGYYINIIYIAQGTTQAFKERGKPRRYWKYSKVLRSIGEYLLLGRNVSCRILAIQLDLH